MAHFAKINKDNIVIEIHVVSDANTCDANGNEDESIGVEFLKHLLGQETNWVKTSYNGNIRKNYAGIGYTYNKELDAFIPPKPFDSWVLDEDLAYYVSPVAKPEEKNKIYFWTEKTQEWVESEEKPFEESSVATTVEYLTETVMPTSIIDQLA